MKTNIFVIHARELSTSFFTSLLSELKIVFTTSASWFYFSNHQAQKYTKCMKSKLISLTHVLFMLSLCFLWNGKLVWIQWKAQIAKKRKNQSILMNLAFNSFALFRVSEASFSLFRFCCGELFGLQPNYPRIIYIIQGTAVVVHSVQ